MTEKEKQVLEIINNIISTSKDAQITILANKAKEIITAKPIEVAYLELILPSLPPLQVLDLGDAHTTEIRTYTQLPPTFITSFTKLCKENKHLSAKLISYSKDNQPMEQKELSGIYPMDVQWDNQLCAADITFAMNCF